MSFIAGLALGAAFSKFWLALWDMGVDFVKNLTK